MDLISYAPRLPELGETLHGNRFHKGFGGKGANQAVMAAKLGADVAMISKLGEDSFGRDTLENFKDCGVDARYVYSTDKAFSGVGAVSVDSDGHNAIIIVTGANDLLTVEEIEEAEAAIGSASILICQLETPVEASLAAFRIARRNGVKTIFNPAPATTGVPEEFFSLTDIICPNETETAQLTGLPVETMAEAEEAAEELRKRGPGTVILTLGEKGSLMARDDRTEHIPADPAKAIDSTGAGDSFIGSLAFFLASGKDLPDAVGRASKIAAISVQFRGAQDSFPDASDLPKDLLA